MDKREVKPAKNSSKKKIEPNYLQSQTKHINKETSLSEPETEKKKVKDSSSSLMIGEGVTITGTIKADNEVTIQGTLDGDVDCHCLIVSKSGNIKGKIKTETLTIEGKSDGEITINDLLQIKSTGLVSGKVIYGKIQVEDGGKLIGEINYRDKEHKQEEFKDWKAL